MKIKIYCIIDINGLKYVGKTKQKLHRRLVGHKTNKKNNNKGCSSILLDLDNCKMILLCECNEDEAKYMEQHFIDNIKCVNIRNPNTNKVEYAKKYNKQYYIDNKNKQKERDLFRQKRVCNGCYDFIKMLEQHN